MRYRLLCLIYCMMLHTCLVNSTGHLTPDEKKRLLDVLNIYRSGVTPLASGMEYLVWDEEMERMAQLWVENCNISLGQDQPYGLTSHVGNFPDPELSASFWYNQQHNYSYAAFTCKDGGNKCEDYLQITYRRNSRIGCARKLCGQLWYTACYYNVNQNEKCPWVRGTYPYQFGIPCNTCQHRGSKCYMNLCISPEVCTANPDICEKAECSLKCQNCGKLDIEKCECQCTDGWDGTDCKSPCIDKSSHCSASYCDGDSFHAVLEQQIYCRKFCTGCKGATPTSNNLCCGGKMCTEGYVLNSECECQIYPLTWSREDKRMLLFYQRYVP